MFGLIGRIVAVPGGREAIVDALLAGVNDMPGCLSYVVALDPSDDVSIWVTEVWDSAENHKASLALPSVQAAIKVARPLIAGFEDRRETRPVGGVGMG
jgi:quinol monooxygenase YgiN